MDTYYADDETEYGVHKSGLKTAAAAAEVAALDMASDTQNMATTTWSKELTPSVWGEETS